MGLTQAEISLAYSKSAKLALDLLDCDFYYNYLFFQIFERKQLINQKKKKKKISNGCSPSF